MGESRLCAGLCCFMMALATATITNCTIRLQLKKFQSRTMWAIRRGYDGKVSDACWRRKRVRKHIDVCKGVMSILKICTIKKRNFSSAQLKKKSVSQPAAAAGIWRFGAMDVHGLFSLFADCYVSGVCARIQHHRLTNRLAQQSDMETRPRKLILAKRSQSFSQSSVRCCTKALFTTLTAIVFGCANFRHPAYAHIPRKLLIEFVASEFIFNCLLLL